MELAAEYNDIWKTSRKDPPEILFHYTNADGLIGICNTRKMWATRYDYLNDPIEDKYGRDLIADELHEAADKQSDAQIKKFLLSTATGLSDRILSFDDQWYIVSFSEDGDDLSQWRSYSDDGNGYCLGFEVNGDSGFNGEFLHPVIYDKQDQTALIKKVVKLCVEHLSNHEITPNLLISLSYSMVPVLAQLSITMKQPAYESEREWRFMFNSNRGKYDHVHFRSNKQNRIVPYIESELVSIDTELESLPIKSVTLGPQRGKDQSSVDLLLKKSFSKYIQIKQSEIKYGRIIE